MEENIEIKLEDFFSDPKWSKYSNENHKASYFDKGHSVVRGNMKDHILRKLSTDYHLPIEIVGKKDDKKIKMSSKRSIPLPTSNHDLRKLRGKTKSHDMAVVGFRNYIVKLLRLTETSEVNQQFINDNLLKSKKMWLRNARILVLTNEAITSDLKENSNLNKVLEDDLTNFTRIYYQRLSESIDSYFNKLKMILEGQIDFKERYFCDFEPDYPNDIHGYIMRGEKKIRELSVDEYAECKKEYGLIKKERYINPIRSDQMLDDFESNYGFRRMWIEYELDYIKLINKDYYDNLYTKINNPHFEENILRSWLCGRYRKLIGVEFKQDHIKDNVLETFLSGSNDIDEVRYCKRRVYTKYSMEIDREVLLPTYIDSIDDIQQSFMKLDYALEEYRYLKRRISEYESNVNKVSFSKVMDSKFLAEKYITFIDKEKLH